MATITIRNLADDVHQRLKREAAANHRSLEAEVRAQLQNSFDVEDWVERQQDAVRGLRERHGDASEDSVATIRAVRDEG